MAQEDSATGDLPMSEETMEGSRAVPVVPVVPDPLKPKSSKSSGVVPVVPETLETDEQVMLNYQMAVFFFAWLDVLSTLLSVLTLYAWPSTKGLQLWQSLFLLLLLGPACGYLGASKLKRSLVGVFVASCLLKAMLQITYAVYSLYFWTMLFAFLQCWITKIAGTFWYFLGKVPKERRREVRLACGSTETMQV
mmetsp:Transcript_78229/g.172634  ORF Transcript_78229/g.172634 Transcript_78229/m.172634 type:complete len:193 (+) Transcript_78229:45-623(+)